MHYTLLSCCRRSDIRKFKSSWSSRLSASETKVLSGCPTEDTIAVYSRRP